MVRNHPGCFRETKDMFSDAFPPCLGPLPPHPTPYPTPGGSKYSPKARFEANPSSEVTFPTKWTYLGAQKASEDKSHHQKHAKFAQESI